MAGEIQHNDDTTGITLYAVIRNVTGQVWNTTGTPAFETQVNANWVNGEYDIVMTETPAAGYFYVGDLPAVDLENITIKIHQKVGGAHAVNDPEKGSILQFMWNGSVASTPDVNVTFAAGDVVNLVTEIESDLIKIHGTALTETSGQLAAGFVTFFDVASPVFTAESINQTGDNYLIVSHADYGNAKLVRSTTPANTLSVDASNRALSNLAAILGTALTETAGLLAGGFKKLFNVASPVFTMQSVNQTGDSFGRIEANGAGLTAITGAKLASDGLDLVTSWTVDITGDLSGSVGSVLALGPEACRDVAQSVGNGISWFVETTGNDGNDGKSFDTSFLTLGAAESAASAGDRINIGAGTFTEQVVFSKALQVYGRGSGVTIITSSNSGDVLTGASGCILSGLTVISTSVGISTAIAFSVKTNFIIRDCQAIGPTAGLSCSGCSNFYMESCYVSSIWDGGLFFGSFDFVISDTIFRTDGSTRTDREVRALGRPGDGLYYNCKFIATRAIQATEKTIAVNSDTTDVTMFVDCQFIASVTNVDSAADVIGIGIDGSDSNVTVVGGAVETSHSGSGNQYDLQRVAGELSVSGLSYDTTKTDGTITDLDERAVQNIVVDNNLDHLLKTATATADMTSELADNTIFSRMLANGDTSAFVPSTDGLQPIRDRGDAAWVTATGFSTEVMRGTDNAALASINTEARLARLDADVSSRAVAGDAMSLVDAENIYHADVFLTRDTTNSRDEYTVHWYLNGIPITSGITVPTIQIVKRSDGTDLISATALTQIGTTGAYKLDTTTRLASGEAALAVVVATIDGSSRTWRRTVGRDI